MSTTSSSTSSSDRDYLVTVHGPTNPAVPAHVPLRDTTLVWERIRDGRRHAWTPMEISHAIVASMNEGMEETLEVVTEDVWSLEQRVTLGRMGDPEQFLDEMFRTRHALLAVANVTATGLEVYERMASVARGITEADRQLLADNIDQFRRVNRLADRAARVPPGSHRVLPDAHGHQDDDRRRDGWP